VTATFHFQAISLNPELYPIFFMTHAEKVQPFGSNYLVFHELARVVIGLLKQLSLKTLSLEAVSSGIVAVLFGSDTLWMALPSMLTTSWVSPNRRHAAHEQFWKRRG
jgi:hypothetical protein